MYKIFASPNAAIVKMAADILAQHEIGFVLRNEKLASAAGELPWTDVWPEIWLLDERQLGLARELLVPFEGEEDVAESPAKSWRCEVCGENVEPQFTDCWSCGTPRSE